MKKGLKHPKKPETEVIFLTRQVSRVTNREKLIGMLIYGGDFDKYCFDDYIEMILNCIKCPPYAVKCKGRESEMKESMCYLCKRDWLDSEVDE